MDPSEKQWAKARAFAEGMNCIAIFLCRPAFRKFRTNLPGLMRKWPGEYGPAFRETAADPLWRRSLRRSGRDPAFDAAIAKISVLAGQELDLDSEDQLSPFRAAVREVMIAMGAPLAKLSPDEAAVCGLHGSSCPFLKPD